MGSADRHPLSPRLDHCPDGLPRPAYIDAGWYARELATIFARQWVMVGRADDFSAGVMRRVTVGEAQVIVETILAMARALRMRTIAEGVEHAVEAAMLTERGCAAFQGFLVSQPLPADEVVPFLSAWRALDIDRLEDAVAA